MIVSSRSCTPTTASACLPAARAPQQGPPQPVDVRVLLPDGRERVIHVEGETTIDERGQVVRMQGTLQDVTERKALEDRLRESEARYASTVELAAVGIAHIDKEGRFVWSNQRLRDMLGYSSDELDEAHGVASLASGRCARHGHRPQTTPRGRDRYADGGKALSAQRRRHALGSHHERGAARRRRHPAVRRIHRRRRHRSQECRGACPVSRDSRRADWFAQSSAVRRVAWSRDREGSTTRAPVRGRLPRPRSLQDRQRLPGARSRRPAAEGGRRAATSEREKVRLASRDSVETSSCCCSRT